MMSVYVASSSVKEGELSQGFLGGGGGGCGANIQGGLILVCTIFLKRYIKVVIWCTSDHNAQFYHHVFSCTFFMNFDPEQVQILLTPIRTSGDCSDWKQSRMHLKCINTELTSTV